MLRAGLKKVEALRTSNFEFAAQVCAFFVLASDH